MTYGKNHFEPFELLGFCVDGLEKFRGLSVVNALDGFLDVKCWAC
jgi:hypothetical protein